MPTVTRIPRMQALPPIISGRCVMRSSVSMHGLPVRRFCNITAKERTSYASCLPPHPTGRWTGSRAKTYILGLMHGLFDHLTRAAIVIESASVVEFLAGILRDTAFSSGAIANTETLPQRDDAPARSPCPKADRQCLKNSQQLTEQGPRRHNHWIGTTETINRYKRNVNYCLKSMFCLCLMLEVGQRVRQPSVASLYLNQKPGLAIADYEKIHLAFELVAQV